MATVPPSPTIKATATVYKDRKGEFRWRVVAHNGKKLANSGESYKRRIDCLRGMTLAGLAIFAHET
jgi:uncharacterized protein YegP (UPF0339 family)